MGTKLHFTTQEREDAYLFLGQYAADQSNPGLARIAFLTMIGQQIEQLTLEAVNDHFGRKKR